VTKKASENESFGMLETKILGVRYETNDVEVLFVGMLLGMLINYLSVKAYEDVQKFGNLLSSKCRSLVPRPRAIPADEDPNEGYGTDGDLDPNVPNLHLRVYHVHHSENSVVETKTICLVCLRTARRLHREHDERASST
jgi:hypothetical protein